MQLLTQLYNTILVAPTVNVLLFFNYVFSLLHLPGTFGFSIIALVASIRLLIHPLARQQIELSRKMEEMKPHLDKLNEKHKNDKRKLQQEQMKLYQEMGVNPASGCLFAIVQIPIFIALYNVLQLFLIGGADKVVETVNKITYVDFLKITELNPWFFGLNLAATPQEFSKYGIWYLAIPVITGLLQYYQVKVTMPQQKSSPKKKKDGKGKEPDMQSMMGKQMQLMFPLMIGYFSFILPVGLALYWNIFSIFSIIQYRKPRPSSPTKSGNH